MVVLLAWISRYPLIGKFEQCSATGQLGGVRMLKPWKQVSLMQTSDNGKEFTGHRAIANGFCLVQSNAQQVECVS